MNAARSSRIRALSSLAVAVGFEARRLRLLAPPSLGGFAETILDAMQDGGNATRCGLKGATSVDEVLKPIAAQVDRFLDELKGNDLFEEAHVVGSIAKRDSLRAFDRRGFGTSDVDFILTTRDVSALPWAERFQYRDRVAQFVEQLRERMNAVGLGREVHIEVGDLLEGEGSIRIWGRK